MSHTVTDGRISRILEYYKSIREAASWGVDAYITESELCLLAETGVAGQDPGRPYKKSKITKDIMTLLPH